jgi:hypothetical protein
MLIKRSRQLEWRGIHAQRDRIDIRASGIASGAIMYTGLRKISLIWTVPGLLLVALATTLAWPSATDSGSGQNWTKIRVELPVSGTQFPPGDAAEITPQCLICQSAGNGACAIAVDSDSIKPPRIPFECSRTPLRC